MKLQDRLDAFTAELIKGGKIPESLVVKLLVVGYGSEAALTRAFRSRFGTTPAAFRREAARQEESGADP